jgi:undecaprenyl-diphosphatase
LLIELLVSIDQRVALFINSFVGRSPLFDFVMKGLANDYFMPVVSCLALVGLWFSGHDIPERRYNQKVVFKAALSLGVADGVVALFNLFLFRSRPFSEIPVHVLINKPWDSSFPSNAATVFFGLAFAVWLNDRRLGAFLMAITSIMGLGRVYAGMHYPLDIIGGAIIGFACALAVQSVFRGLNPVADALLEMAGRFNLA